MPRSVAGTASDPTIEFAKLTIDGKDYQLAYDFNAIAEAERLADCNLLQGIAGVILNNWTASQLRGLLYAALRIAHPRLSLTDVGKLVRLDTMPDIRDALVMAYNASLPEAKKIVVNPPEGAPGESGNQESPTPAPAN